MGGKNIQTGVILPAIGVKAGQSTDVELSMETCANIGGSGTPDGVTVTVEITAGPGTVNGDSEKLCEPMTPAPSWGWTPMSVKLYGITADTRIVIRSTQQGTKRLLPLVPRRHQNDEDRSRIVLRCQINEKQEDRYEKQICRYGKILCRVFSAFRVLPLSLIHISEPTRP